MRKFFHANLPIADGRDQRLAPADPQFLRNRTDEYYVDRLAVAWQGDHLLKGQAPGPNAIQLMSNDYLALSKHPKILRAKQDCLQACGNGMVMSGVFLHDNDPQHAFEASMAEFLEAEAALLCQSGWCANTGLLQSIASRNTPIYLDMFAHMSMWEGARIASDAVYAVRHNSASHLERQIKQHGPGVVVVDSVYSTSGDIAALTDFVQVANLYDCVVVVDESHSLGVYGEQGAGLVSELGLSTQVHFRTASLAKAFAGRGGIILGSERNMGFVRYASRPAIFSSTLLPHDIAGFSATLSVIKHESWRRQQLRRNANLLRMHLRSMGYNVMANQSQIIALESGTEAQTQILRDALQENDIFGAVFCAPATPKNRALVRFTLHCDLTSDELHRIAAVCYRIRDRVGMKNWNSTARFAKAQAKRRQACLSARTASNDKRRLADLYDN